MNSLAVGGYTTDEIKNALQMDTGSRTVDFRFELLDKNDGYLGDLDECTGSISHDSENEIKLTGNFSVKTNVANDIDFSSARIKPYFRLKMPSGYVEWPLGVLLANCPEKTTDSQGKLTASIDGYDKCQILVEDKFLDRYTVAAGTNYEAAVEQLLYGAGITQINIAPSDFTLATALQFEPNTSKLAAINTLLKAINYNSLHFDASGFAVSGSYVEPSLRAPEYEYRTDAMSIIKPQLKLRLDLFNVPNIFRRAVSAPDRPVLTSTYINTDPSSPLSTTRKGRNIVDYDTISDIADQATLDAYVRRVAINASSLYQETAFTTAIMPHHSFEDCLFVEYVDAGGVVVSDIFIETAWSMELRAGADMNHVCRKVVNLPT